MSDLNVALVLRLIDQMSAPLRQVKEALTGVKGETDKGDSGLKKVTTGAQGAGEALKEAFGPHLPKQIDAMNRSAEKAVGVFGKLRRAGSDFGSAFGAEIRKGFTAENIDAALQKNERAIATARGRLMGAAGMAMSLAAPVWAAGNFERDLINYGNLADMNKSKLAALAKELDLLSRRDRTGMGKSDLLAGLSTYVGKGMSNADGIAALEATGRAAKATGASFDEMAAAGFAAMDNLKVTPQQLAKAFDIMAASGKEGSFELQDMARKFPELTASAQALGMTGEQGVASLAAALQVAMKAAGSADQAATNTANFLGKLTTPDAVKNFKAFGVNVEKELKTAAKNGADPLEHMLDVIDRVTKGDQFKMGELFADKQVLDFLRAAIPNLEEYRRIKAAAASAEGVVDRDYKNVMGGFNESLLQLRASLTGLFSASGALLPALTDLVQTATGMVDALRDWTAANPELTAWLVKGAALMLTMGVAGRVLGYVFAVGRGNLIRFLALFLKFNEAGRNISLIARLLRGLGTGFRWAIPKLRWGASVSALNWAAFVPRLIWRLPRLAWGAFVSVLNWSAFVPRLIWRLPRLAWGAFVTALNWAAFVPRMIWSLPRLAWGAFISALTWAKFIPKLTLRDFGPGVTDIGPAMARAAAQTEAAAARMKKAIQGVQIKALATGGMLMALERNAPNYGPSGDAQRRANTQSLDRTFRATPGLSQLVRAYDWTYSKVHGEAPPEPGAAPPRRVAPAAPKFNPSLHSLLPAESTGEAEILAYLKRVSVQPPAAAGGLGAARPVPRPEPVKVEETINHDYKSQQSVTVTVPTTIIKEYKADIGALARDVGQRTERAVRKSLSDAYGPQ